MPQSLDSADDLIELCAFHSMIRFENVAARVEFNLKRITRSFMFQHPLIKRFNNISLYIHTASSGE